jgi:hypothetical protein
LKHPGSAQGRSSEIDGVSEGRDGITWYSGEGGWLSNWSVDDGRLRDECDSCWLFEEVSSVFLGSLLGISRLRRFLQFLSPTIGGSGAAFLILALECRMGM